MATIGTASRDFSRYTGVATSASCACVRRSHAAALVSTLELSAAAAPRRTPGGGWPAVDRASLPGRSPGAVAETNLSSFFDGTVKNCARSLRQNVLLRPDRRRGEAKALGAETGAKIPLGSWARGCTHLQGGAPPSPLAGEGVGRRPTRTNALHSPWDEGGAARRVVSIGAIRGNLCSISLGTRTNAEAMRLAARPLIRPAKARRKTGVFRRPLPATFPRKGGRGACLHVAYLSDIQRELDLCASPSAREGSLGAGAPAYGGPGEGSGS